MPDLRPCTVTMVTRLRVRELVGVWMRQRSLVDNAPRTPHMRIRSLHTSSQHPHTSVPAVSGPTLVEHSLCFRLSDDHPITRSFGQGFRLNEVICLIL